MLENIFSVIPRSPSLVILSGAKNPLLRVLRVNSATRNAIWMAFRLHLFSTVPRSLLLLAVGLLLAGQLGGNPRLAAQGGNGEPSEELSREAAQSAAAKFDLIREAHDSGVPFDSVRITELEANSYLHFEMSSVLPAGVSQARLAFQPGRVLGSTLVDFDKLKEGRRSPPHPIADFLLRGEHKISVEGIAWGTNGIGEFRLEQVMLNDVPLPQPVVEFLIEHYLRPRYPSAAINRPFRLPFSIDGARAEAGSVVMTGKAGRGVGSRE